MMDRLKYLERLIILFASIPFVYQAQANEPDRLQYSGPLHSGNVQCCYFEDENEQRIYDGSFDFKFENEDYAYDNLSGNPEVYRVLGTFENGVKTGGWEYILSGVGGDGYNQFRESITIDYINGKPTKYSFNTETPHFDSHLEYELIDEIITKGIYVQKLRPDFGNWSGSLSFCFNKDGKPDGEWSWKPDFDESSMIEPIQISQFYNNGVLQRIKFKNIATGEISTSKTVQNEEKPTEEFFPDKDFASQIHSEPAELILKFNIAVIERIGKPSPKVYHLILP